MLKFILNSHVQAFLECYLKNDLIGATSHLIKSPDNSYDLIQTEDPLLIKLINFVDASVYRNSGAAYHQLLILIGTINKCLLKNGSNELLSKCLPLLNEEAQILSKWISKDEIDRVNLLRTSQHTALLNFHQTLLKNWHELKKLKPRFFADFENKYNDMHPWYPLRYPLSLPNFTDIPQNKIPVIFLEPIHEGLHELLKSFENRSAILLFSTISTFFQMLQFPEVYESLKDSRHLLYISELYPNQQFRSQEILEFQGKDLSPVFCIKTQYQTESSPSMLKALNASLNQPLQALDHDTVEGDCLYNHARRLIYFTQQQRLGITRTPALLVENTLLEWNNMHKGLLSAKTREAYDFPDLMHTVLENLHKPVKKNPVKKSRLKIAHIVQQIVWGGHAPSRLLRNLIIHHDPSKFDVIVVSSEILHEHLLEYPFNAHVAHSSLEWGKNQLIELEQLGIRYFINQNRPTYIEDAKQLIALLNSEQIDVAIFHGPDTVNTMIAQSIEAPLKVLFEHGTPPAYKGFDLAVVSTIDANEIFKELYTKLGTAVAPLPFSIDSKSGWLPEPTPLSTLGIPEDSLVMTTISTKLDSRLTNEMCECIAKILKAVPKACYAPIGNIQNEARIRDIFNRYEVMDRFFPLGHRKNPSQYARSMHLYLNEFPFGSCLGILDAMAACCPIISMYDVKGPQQSRYAGNFLGIDWVISTCSQQEYIHLACNLLNDPEMYKQWSLHTLNCYEALSDVKTYVRSFESILLNAYGNQALN